MSAATCGHTFTTARFVWTCIRPPHSWSPKGATVARFRLRSGKPQQPDRHVYTSSPR